MIKKILGFILVIGLGFVGFSNATTQQVGLTSNPSSIDNNFEITALTKGRLLTNYLGIGKGLFAFSDSRLFFWSTNGIPYLYFSNSIQGYFNKYSLCSYSIGSNGSMSLSSCYNYNLDYNSISAVNNFFNGVSNGDYFYYSISSSPYRFCWSSSISQNALCFNSNTLTGSLGYSGLNFSNISASIYQNGPSGSSSDSGSISGIGTGIVQTVCPTVGQLLSYYDSSIYNTGICYSPSIIYTGGSFQTVTPSSIFELFTDLNDYKQYLQLYGTYCNSVSTMCEQAFSGKELQYLYIANLNSSLRSSEKQVYQYCNLALNYDPNTSSCIGSGVIQPGDQISRNDVVQGIVNNNYQTVLPVTGLVNGDSTVYNIFSSQFSSEYTGDVLDQIGLIFTKFTSLFKQQTSGGNGILPSYIIVALLGIILFKLFKK